MADSSAKHHPPSDRATQASAPDASDGTQPTTDTPPCDSSHLAELGAYRNALSAMAVKLSRAVDDERTRIARGLHDDLGQTLVAAQLRLAELKGAGVDPHVRTAIQQVSDLVGEAVSSSRSLTFELMTPLMPELGIDHELKHLTSRIAERYNIDGRFETDGLPKPMGREEAEALLRAVRELLVNVGKHARARTAWVRIARHDRYAEATVRDDGIGFDTRRQSGVPASGFGLLIIRERLRELNGQVAITSSPGSGAEIVLTIPLLDET
ncbi:MAG: sensor histidine kinase [Acidimicrobiia bacterium]|nr:sensor histidine kinase [Acidimicrobiia bacterium]